MLAAAFLLANGMTAPLTGRDQSFASGGYVGGPTMAVIAIAARASGHGGRFSTRPASPLEWCRYRSPAGV